MSTPANTETFDEIVEWLTALCRRRSKTSRLPRHSGRRRASCGRLEEKELARGTEMLGCYSGVVRTKQSHMQMKVAPDLIFVFRGPILRCSRGNLRAEVKRVVWHEVAHWLGYETEEQVQALGL